MAFSSDPFRSARLKVERALHFIDELNAVADSFAASPFYEIVARGEAEKWIVICSIRAIPEELPLIIGDGFHDLRAALDHLATATSRAGGGSGKDLFFPFHKERKNLSMDTAKLNPIEQALPGAKRLIVDEIQPCENGNGALLYALHALEKIDKHNQLLITTTVALSGHLIVRENGDVKLAAANIRFDAGRETTIPIGPFHGHVTVEHSYKAAVEVSLDEAGPFSRKPIGAVMADLAARVTEVIDAFERLVPD